MPIAMLLLELPRWIGWLVVEVCLCVGLLYEGIWRDRRDPRRRFRLIHAGGRGMLLSALLLCASRWGWDLGLLIWLAMLAAATGLVLCLLPLLSRIARALMPQSLVLGFAVIGRLLA